MKYSILVACLVGLLFIGTAGARGFTVVFSPIEQSGFVIYSEDLKVDMFCIVLDETVKCISDRGVRYLKLNDFLIAFQSSLEGQIVPQWFIGPNTDRSAPEKAPSIEY